MAQSWIWSVTEAEAEATPRSKQKITRDKKHYLGNNTRNSISFAGYFEATIWIEMTSMIS